MVPHPNSIITAAELHRQDLLATVARERRAAIVVAPAPPWRPLAARVLALVALSFGLHS